MRFLAEKDDEGFTLVVKNDKRARENARNSQCGYERMLELVDKLANVDRVYLQMNTSLTGVDIRFEKLGVCESKRPVVQMKFEGGFNLSTLESRRWFLDDRSIVTKREPNVDVWYWSDRLLDRVVWVRVAKDFEGLEMYDFIPNTKKDSRPVGVLKLENGAVFTIGGHQQATV